MKPIVALFVCVTVLCLFSRAQSVECPPFPGLNQTEPSTPGTRIHHECRQYDCASSGSWHVLGCALSTCVKQIGYVDYDYSKPYPECCPHPICG
ncbi:hypothetical protein PV327_004452 [Microctonus hyperodae]|uniref:Single domain-containing protein n=1 Tax=Microctonus hyperodae TaxID=165561 RepID=A0AA39FCF7_MICHY|nr:hypothetical protein PV327_004452 [Microctonus hyperodae]